MTMVPNDLGGHPVLKMDETYHETLKWINRIRRKHGKGGLKKIRKGFRGRSYDCPVTNSLRDCMPDATTGRVYFWPNGAESKEPITLPEFVRQFIRNFDNEKSYHELLK